MSKLPKRTSTIPVALSKVEMGMIDDAAAQSGMSRSGWVRNAAVSAARQLLDDPDHEPTNDKEKAT